PIEAGDKFHLDRVDACQKDDRNRSGRRLCGQRRRSIRDDHGHLSADQIGRQHWESVVLILRETVFNDDVLALDIARFFQALAKRRQDVCILAAPPAVEKSNHRHLWLLRACRERSSRRSTKQRDELAAFHSITSSASASSLSGTSMPSARAVLRLITNSNLVGCWTGKSFGLVPLRICPT